MDTFKSGVTNLKPGDDVEHDSFAAAMARANEVSEQKARKRQHRRKVLLAVTQHKDGEE